jgi:hypothetical protein
MTTSLRFWNPKLNTYPIGMTFLRFWQLFFSYIISLPSIPHIPSMNSRTASNLDFVFKLRKNLIRSNPSPKQPSWNANFLGPGGCFGEGFERTYF